ncbi:glycosyltransferase family 2 protein [Gemmobacter serpentinus]|uniref:glycosyltransferase family 2 protein n=1 Tax=Gemmobacter serpentinus TaxID=2652247 RepID=UPI00124EDEDA|nr:glycosyltransferase family 2 protein [Gemmobacter serpentinus]
MTRILSVTAIRDEGPFLLEWLAWHRLLGVTDFLVFSNDCSDGSDRMLEALAQAGVLTHVPHQAPPEKSVQWQALKSAWQHPLRKHADWMLVSDVDEFPMIHIGAHRFADLLAALPETTEAVALGWRLFGANGVLGLVDQPVTAQFLRSAPPDMVHPIGASYFKTLFRPRAFRKPGVHRPLRAPDAPPAQWVDGSGRALPDLHSGNDKRLSLLPLTGYRALAEMHHYSLRSVESFIVKSERGLPNRSVKQIDLHYWVERNFNSVLNEAALALQTPLAQEIAALKALPGVADLHGAAFDWHRQQAQALLRRPEAYRLYTGCLHAAGSSALPPRLGQDLLMRFQQLEG